jgi:hypothetical protein
MTLPVGRGTDRIKAIRVKGAKRRNEKRSGRHVAAHDGRRFSSAFPLREIRSERVTLHLVDGSEHNHY